jgi:mono/diheme cytochrome c family protein
MNVQAGSLRWGLWATALSVALVSPAAAAEPESSALFTTKCASCHTFGKGDRIGPDLKGATERHSRTWLTAWIRSSDKMIRAGDANAVALFRKYRSQRMPDHELTDAQVGALLDYLAAGGPELDERRQVRQAHTASTEEVTLGNSIFYGKVPLAGGSLACASCHTVSKQRALGGSLAPDLTQVYTKFWDKALNRRLERYCLPRVASVKDMKRVNDRESLALRAFLRTVNLDELRATAAAPSGSAWP